MTRRYSFGLLNFTRLPEDSRYNRNAVLRSLKGPYRRDCSSTEQ